MIEFIGAISEKELAKADKDTIAMIKSHALVRCRECEQADFAGLHGGRLYCMEHEHYMFEDEFCSYAERRTDD